MNNWSRYARGNRFSPFINIPDATLLWAGLHEEEHRYVFIDERGLPRHLDRMEIKERAEGLVEAAHRGEIFGYTHTEDGYPLSPSKMKLLRTSLKSWMDNIELAGEADA